MPFLLQIGLESIRWIDTKDCVQILVVPDGVVEDDRPLRAVAERFNDPRIEVAQLGRIERMLAKALRSRGGATIHWLCIVHGLKRVRGEHVFLHDSDAFPLERAGLERQYRECLSRNLDSLGVDARWDPFFVNRGYQIPGTWELLFRTRWALGHPPHRHKGRIAMTPQGAHNFDTMLLPQFLDFGSGRIGVMAAPPRFVHFSGTIVTYREFRQRQGARVNDELFRILLLSLLEEVVRAASDIPLLPSPDLLARSLTDSSAPIRYDTETAQRGYLEFRSMMRQLCEAPMFRGERAERIERLLAPFDEHWARLEAEAGGPLGPPVQRLREHGLG